MEGKGEKRVTHKEREGKRKGKREEEKWVKLNRKENRSKEE